MYLYLISYVAIRDVRVINVFTVFIRINAPGVMDFSKGGGGGGGGGGGLLLQIKKINSRVQWQLAIMDTCSLDLASQHV